jgi:hypothetical protein
MAPSMLILIVFTATLACTKRALFITKKAQIVPPVPPPPPHSSYAPVQNSYNIDAPCKYKKFL